MGEFGIGQSVRRFEDTRLLRGGGRYINDIDIPGQAYAVLLRSPHAHAKIRTLSIDAAKAAAGVLAVYTHAEYAAAGLGTTAPTLKRTRPDGTPMFGKVHPVLAKDRVRYVGEPVAMVVAETLAQAKDGAELIEVEYEPLPSITATADATTSGSAAVWDECPDNISHVWQTGDAAATEAAFRSAAHVVRRRYVISRVHAQFMEPRGAIGEYDQREDRYVLHADVQYPHRVRQVLADRVFKVPEYKVRVVAGDVGGGFGTKGWQYPEHRLVLWAARRLGRAVKWSCERSEAILADEHGRDNVTDIELALDRDGKFLALRARTLANIGAYLSSDRNLLSIFTSVAALTGVYAFAAAHAQVTAVITNTNATAPYRGAGRPEAIYVIERVIDDAARELERDPIELRRKNLIPASAMPYKTALGFTYDCGDFPRNLEDGLKASDHAGFAGRRDESKRRGKLRGIGLANAIERAAGAGLEYAEIRFNPGGTGMLLMGSKNQGQGHETTFKQVVAERLGIDPTDLQYVDGDTDKVAFGIGTNGSRSTVIGGSAAWIAAGKLVDKGRKIAAHLLEAAETDVAFENGRFTVTGTDRGLSLKEVARAAFQAGKLPRGVEPGFYESGTFSPATDTFPNGTHVCEVEIDPDTGAVQVVSYLVVDDVGTVINPLTLKGQIHGGVAQGLGQVLMEQVAYDPESGQLLSASFMDYAMPRASDMSDITVKSNPVPTKLNPLGAKGAGEAGTVGALPAVMNAILDALAPLGVHSLDMPATSDKVWQTIQAARR
jgi:carbon-monoxide dehydrogenase large subunit